MQPSRRRQRAKDAIRSLIDLDRWNHAVNVEVAERESMHTFMDTWNGLISQPAANYSGGDHA